MKSGVGVLARKIKLAIAVALEPYISHYSLDHIAQAIYWTVKFINEGRR